MPRQAGPNVTEAVRSKLLLEVLPSPRQVFVGPIAILRGDTLEDARQVPVEPPLVLLTPARRSSYARKELQEPFRQAAAGDQLTGR